MKPVRIAGRAVMVCAMFLLSVVALADVALATTPTCGNDGRAFITSSVKLESDLECSLIIQASDVTIDLNGHKLTGAVPTPNWSGIKTWHTISSFENIRIMNGTIEGFEHGIQIHNTVGLTIRNVVITNPAYGYGILVTNSRNVSVWTAVITSDILITESYTSGIRLERVAAANVRDVYTRGFLVGIGVGCSDCASGEIVNTGGSITDCALTNNGSGLILTHSANYTITRNRISGGRGFGIGGGFDPGTGSHDIRVADNTVAGSEAGIGFANLTGSSVANNTCVNNDGGGVWMMWGSSGNTVANNFVFGNGPDLLSYEPGNTWRGNLCMTWDGPDASCSVGVP